MSLVDGYLDDVKQDNILAEKQRLQRLREQFAIKAFEFCHRYGLDSEKRAKKAVEMADALIKHLTQDGGDK